MQVSGLTRQQQQIWRVVWVDRGRACALHAHWLDIRRPVAPFATRPRPAKPLRRVIHDWPAIPVPASLASGRRDARVHWIARRQASRRECRARCVERRQELFWLLLRPARK